MKKVLLFLLLTLSLTAFIAGGKKKPCPKTGDAKDTRSKNLDINKNRDTEPSSSETIKSITLDQILNSKDDSTAFNTKKAAFIEGYFLEAIQERGESCNCHSKEKKQWDFHCYLAPTSKTKKIGECAVIEITPYSRAIHPEWTLKYLNSLKGKKVKVKGWLLYDYHHTNVSFETQHNKKKAKRKTVWEIHPITSIEVL